MEWISNVIKIAREKPEVKYAIAMMVFCLFFAVKDWFNDKQTYAEMARKDAKYDTLFVKYEQVQDEFNDHMRADTEYEQQQRNVDDSTLVILKKYESIVKNNLKDTR